MSATTPEESAARQSWKTGSKTQIYSNSRQHWYTGEIQNIFHDDEGEWLEVRYDKSMSKQVQRYSTDIKPTEEQLKRALQKLSGKSKSPSPTSTASPSTGGITESISSTFDEKELEEHMVEKTRQVRATWTKDDYVEIFSNTHQEWYLGQVVDIVKDEEGEWLNCVWHRENGEAMSKQVQRYSTDVRPPQGKQAEKVAKKKGGKKTHPTYKSLQEEIKSRMSGFQRKAPYFSRTLRSSTFSRPATSAFRRQKRLGDIVEAVGEGDSDDDLVGMMFSGGDPRAKISAWTPHQVGDWVSNLGEAFRKYKYKFSKVTGSLLLEMEDAQLRKMGLPKLHRSKVFVELNLKVDRDFARRVEDTAVLNWSAARVKVWLYKQSLLNLYCGKFVANGVTGLLLFELDAEDLTTIGVRDAHRKRVLDTIAAFHTSKFPELSLSPASMRGMYVDGEAKDEEFSPLNSLTNDSQLLGLGGDDGDDVGNGLGIMMGSKNRSKKRRGSQMSSTALSMACQTEVFSVLEEMSSLLVLLSQTSTSEEASSMAERLSARVLASKHSFCTEIETTMCEDTDESMTSLTESIARLGLASLSKMSAKDPMIERAAGSMPVAGLDIAKEWFQTLEQKKGHKRRQSVTVSELDASALASLTTDSPEEGEEDDEELSDLE